MLLFDGHCDIWSDIAVQRIDRGKTDVFRSRHLEKFRKGGVKGAIFVIWIDPPYDETDPAGRSLATVQAIRDELAEASDILTNVTRYEQFAQAEQEGKLAIVTGMEGASQIGSDLDLLNFYYSEVGVRDVMLTWNDQNELATSWVKDPERGLTELGKKAVSRIQDLGMTIDVSHLNDRSILDVFSVAHGPVIASHSNTRAICPLTRNLTDDMIREIAATGGLIGMNSIKQLVHEEHDKQNLDTLMKHFEHTLDLAGIDHVALGFDFDDYVDEETLATFIFDGIENPSIPNLSTEAEAQSFILALQDRGYSEEDIRKVAYGNFYELFRKVWK